MDNKHKYTVMYICFYNISSLFLGFKRAQLLRMKSSKKMNNSVHEHLFWEKLEFLVVENGSLYWTCLRKKEKKNHYIVRETSITDSYATNTLWLADQWEYEKWKYKKIHAKMVQFSYRKHGFTLYKLNFSCIASERTFNYLSFINTTENKKGLNT